MKNDHTGSVARIASFLDISAAPELIATVVTLSGFKSMTSTPTTNFDWIPQRADVPSHFRKGDIGDWRNHFSAEQSLQLDAVFTEKIKGSGLQFDFGDGVRLP